MEYKTGDVVIVIRDSVDYNDEIIGKIGVVVDNYDPFRVGIDFSRALNEPSYLWYLDIEDIKKYEPKSYTNDPEYMAAFE